MSAQGSPTGAEVIGEMDGLDAIMRRGGEGLRERMARTERHLERVTAAAGGSLAGHANATILAGGKRLRPLLVVLAAESVGGPSGGPSGEERLVRAAVAVELVHSATLVHDDLIDGAQLRRGRPTVAAVGWAGGRGRHRRSAVLARVRRARAQRGRRAAQSPLRRELGARGG